MSATNQNVAKSSAKRPSKFFLKSFGTVSGYICAFLVYIIFFASIPLLVLLNLVAPIIVNFIGPVIQVLIMGIYYLATSVQFVLRPFNWFSVTFDPIVGFVAQIIAVVLLLLIFAQLFSNIANAKLRWAIAFVAGLWLFALPALALIKLISFFVSLNVDALDFWSI